MAGKVTATAGGKAAVAKPAANPMNKFLAGLKEKWSTANEKVASGGFQQYPDGRYLVRVTSAEIGESQAGRPQIAVHYTVADGELTGEVIRDFWGLESEKNLEFLARDLRRLGYELDDITDLPDAITDLAATKPYVRLRLRTNPQNPEFQNKYLDKVMPPDWEPEDGGIAAGPSATSAEEEEEVAVATPAAEDEEEEEVEIDEEEPGEEELTIGKKVEFTYKGETLTGEVTELFEEEEKVKIRSGNKSYRVSVEKVAIIADGTVD